MSKYDDIYDIAADNYGLVTRDQARRLGVLDSELSRFVDDGRLTRLGYGVYRVKYHVLGELDPYAETVALVGPEAYLFGESVLAFHSLCPTNPTHMIIGTPKRVRRRLPPGTKVVKRVNMGDVTMYEGIPAQRVADAIRTCAESIMPERLEEAVREAARKGLVSEEERRLLLDELEG